jgi:hypothetical protein
MATSKTAKPAARQGANNRSSPDSYYIPPPAVPRNSPDENSEVGFLIALISMVIVFALLLPLMAMMYFDTLELKEQVRKETARIDRVLKEAAKDK